MVNCQTDLNSKHRKAILPSTVGIHERRQGPQALLQSVNPVSHVEGGDDQRTDPREGKENFHYVNGQELTFKNNELGAIFPIHGHFQK